MMHATIAPAMLDQPEHERSFGERARRWFVRWRSLLAIVVLPTLIVAAYYFLIAANQYESEAHFAVRSNEQPLAAASGISATLGLGGIGKSHEDAMNVADYLSSHDVVATLRRVPGIVDVFRRPEADPLSRLWSADPTPEALLKYYARQVNIDLDPESGITTVRVRTFRPSDSLAVVNALMRLGEQRINSLNQRSYTDSLRAARTQLSDAEDAFARSQIQLGSFRSTRSNIDPEGTGQAQVTMVSGLRAQLADGRAQLAAMGSAVSASSPQYVAMAARVRSLAAQVAREDARLTNGKTSIAAGIGDYAALKLRQDFAAKRYDVAAAAFERARDQAQRQQLFLVQTVDPNLPVKALYPKRYKIVITLFFALLLIYALGWLVAAGMREHAA